MTTNCWRWLPAGRCGWVAAYLLGYALLMAGTPTIAPAGEVVLLEEQFASLARWQPQPFAKIPRHSRYSAVTLDGRSCLLMESDNSASALVLTQSFNVYEHPELAWRWKVSNVFAKGDSSSKSGDDYPARLYVMFAYDPDRASLGKRLQYQLAKTIYGKYPPDSSISYIWDNRNTGAAVITNAYTSEAKMIPVDTGPEKVNTWQEHTVDIVRDYRLAFGQDPPATATLAVMNDSDNTHESAQAWIDYIRIFRPR
ncbi:MAG: DUF3047 domain-containing protein [Desulfobulbaceae bacterium]|nr:DUF3047 domain-containing protein [Desulfobulbaceae bacterium]